jgi:hypothetical protein
MKIPSKDVIQADTPERVMATIDAVARGARDDKDIAAAIGGLDARQGRYYRRAAEVLGFMVRDHNRRSTVTPAGKEFANADQSVKWALFTQAVLSNPLFQRLLPFLEGKGAAGVTRDEMELFLNAVADLGAASMVERRVSSYLGWLVKLGLAKTNGKRWVLDHLPAAVPLVRYESDEEPIFPNRYDLKEYQEQAQRVASKQEAIAYYVDWAKRERATTSHEKLVNLMAERLRQRGAIPKANRYVDLSARWEGDDYLFEMKSTTEDNPHSQIRRGLSQLYEYRYIQNVEAAKLVLVIENPLPKQNQWMEDYLLNDRGVLLVWDGNGQFNCSSNIRKQLQFLS